MKFIIDFQWIADYFLNWIMILLSVARLGIKTNLIKQIGSYIPKNIGQVQHKIDISITIQRSKIRKSIGDTVVSGGSDQLNFMPNSFMSSI